MTTNKIYQLAFKMLKGKSRVSASKYKLKKALMQLGPSGFPFEKLVGKIMEQEGFKTNVGVIVQGNCVQYEVDVIAQKDNIPHPSNSINLSDIIAKEVNNLMQHI